MPTSPARILIFAATVCAICALAVSSVAVLLQPRIAQNRELEREKKVLIAAGLISSRTDLSGDQVRDMFRTNVRTQLVQLQTGSISSPAEGLGTLTSETRTAPTNAAGLVRVPLQSLFYIVTPPNRQAVVVLPVEGKGLWSTIRGFIALDAPPLPSSLASSSTNTPRHPVWAAKSTTRAGKPNGKTGWPLTSKAMRFCTWPRGESAPLRNTHMASMPYRGQPSPAAVLPSCCNSGLALMAMARCLSECAKMEDRSGKDSGTSFRSAV